MSLFTDPSTAHYHPIIEKLPKKRCGFSVEEILAPSQPRRVLENYYQQLQNSLLQNIPCFIFPAEARKAQFQPSKNFKHPKQKRIRTIFTKAQIERLEIEFTENKYIVGAARLKLAAELSLSETQVELSSRVRSLQFLYRSKYGSKIVGLNSEKAQHKKIQLKKDRIRILILFNF